ncbi:MAG: Ornithine carbamoyltransferase 1, phaseolotoxin-sensitive [Alphaproteobacteria bacterium MarineAlpha9_Bin4]|nr:ornithine carbamoyltransferase [Pelagibacterales bacterium]PPR26706.1 MAG: Ornithine carbamoyltransferase 1, phaseolotoxin-sensitive [Alphaproteobacteria bacterium MarineAlpha9_Bin4]|tara:strand:- start:2584 stop:3516 length:933 start_codon:yes stop_codon:yes gene_type:complete
MFKGNKLTRNFINLSDINKSQLTVILKRARDLKKYRQKKKSINTLKNINLAMIFEKPSTRTRVSFELAIKELGGRSVILDEASTHLSRGETISDTARVLSKYCNILMIRTTHHQKLLDYHKYSNLPVINGLSNVSHPCQILADIMAYNEKRGSIKNKSFVWMGDINNVLYSWIEAAKIFNFTLNICCPNIIKFPPAFIENIKISSKYIKISHNAMLASKNADCVITDTWFSMGKKPTRKLLQVFKPYQVNKKVMNLAKKSAVFMHCLPATRGNEVSSEVIDNEDSSIVWEEAENRLHVQKAILEWSLRKI